MTTEERVEHLLCQAKKIASDYYSLTKRPLGITGEVAEYEAAKKLNLKLALVRTPFFDASEIVGGREIFYQVKGRAIDRTQPRRGRIGGIKLLGDFDAVLLVLLDRETFEAVEIWKASKQSIQDRMAGLTGAAPRERGAISISQFVSIATGAEKVWPRVQS